MRQAEVSLLFDYLYWVRDRILAAAARLQPREFVSAETVSVRDLRSTLVHELDVQWSWRERLRHGEFPDGDDLRPTDYATVDALADHWRRDEAEMRRWLDGLSDEDLADTPPGESATLPLWYYAMHLTSHGIQQFSEAALLLTAAGQSPGEIGFLEFVGQRTG